MIFLLPYFKLRLRILPFKKIISQLHCEVTNFNLTNELEQHVLFTAYAIEEVSKILPWNYTCLEKSVTGKYLLKRKNIPTTLYLGGMKDVQDNFEAHAWLSCSEKVLLDNGLYKKYSIVGRFH